MLILPSRHLCTDFEGLFRFFDADFLAVLERRDFEAEADLENTEDTGDGLLKSTYFLFRCVPISDSTMFYIIVKYKYTDFHFILNNIFCFISFL